MDVGRFTLNIDMDYFITFLNGRNMNKRCDVCKAQLVANKPYHEVYTQWTPYPRRGYRHFCRQCYNTHFKGKSGNEMIEMFNRINPSNNSG